MEVPPLTRYTTPRSKARNAREELLEKFLERLNPGRVKAGYKAYTFPRLTKLVEGKSVPELDKLYRECEEAKSFGALFNYKTKRRIQPLPKD